MARGVQQETNKTHLAKLRNRMRDLDPGRVRNDYLIQLALKATDGSNEEVEVGGVTSFLGFESVHHLVIGNRTRVSKDVGDGIQAREKGRTSMRVQCEEDAEVEQQESLSSKSKSSS